MSDPRPVPIREVVSALLVNNEGKLLLQLRDDRPDLKYPTQWTPFGGQVEPGEMPDAAIRREVMEELGIDVPLIALVRMLRLGRGLPLVAPDHVETGAIECKMETADACEELRGGRAATGLTLGRCVVLGHASALRLDGGVMGSV